MEDEPKKRKFPTAFTVLAIVLLGVWGLSFVIPSGQVRDRPQDRRSRARHVRRASVVRRRRQGHLRKQGNRRTVPEALARSPTGSTASRTRPAPSPLQQRRPLRRGADLPLRPGRRRVHQRSRCAPVRSSGHQPAGAALPQQPDAAHRHPHGRLRPGRHDVRDVGGDPRVLRPPRGARPGHGLRPHGRRRASSCWAQGRASSRPRSTRSPRAWPRTRRASPSATDCSCGSSCGSCSCPWPSATCCGTRGASPRTRPARSSGWRPARPTGRMSRRCRP